MDQNQKKVVLYCGIMCGIVALAAGIGVYVLSAKGPATTPPGYSTSTPPIEDIAAQPGAITIEPSTITVTRSPDGTLQGLATVTALNQSFTTGEITVTGDPRLTWKSDCLGRSKRLQAGERCSIAIIFRANAGSPANELVQPFLTILGNSQTPGGDTLPVEARADIVGGDAVMTPAQTTSDPILTSGTAPAHIDPYGAPPANAYGAPTHAANYGQPDYNYAPPQPTLTREEQFVLARRQAVFGGAQPSATTAHQTTRPTGGWDELDIPTSTSSLPQNMSRVVTMDRVITAVIARPYDSRSSQQVVAQVDRNVYGAHGRNVLIPRGSQLIGTAQGGSERVAISWTQIIRPDGARFVIEATTGDAMGQGGVPGHINERLMKRYGSILLGTALNAGIAKTLNAKEEAGGDFANAARNNGAIISDIVREDLQRIVQDYVQRNQDIQKVITVPAGTRITVIPTMDLQLRPMSRPKADDRTYPRPQNAGAPVPTANYEPANGSSVGTQTAARAGDREHQALDFSTPPTPDKTVPQNPIITSEAPMTGSTPPWSTQ